MQADASDSEVSVSQMQPETSEPEMFMVGEDGQLPEGIRYAASSGQYVADAGELRHIFRGGGILVEVEVIRNITQYPKPISGITQLVTPEFEMKVIDSLRGELKTGDMVRVLQIMDEIDTPLMVGDKLLVELTTCAIPNLYTIGTMNEFDIYNIGGKDVYIRRLDLSKDYPELKLKNLYKDAVDALTAKQGKKPNYSDLIGVYDRKTFKEKVKSKGA